MGGYFRNVEVVMGWSAKEQVHTHECACDVRRKHSYISMCVTS